MLPLPAVVEAVGPYPAGLGPLATDLTSVLHDRTGPQPEQADLAGVMREAPEPAWRVLDALTWGPPLGTVDPAQPGHGTTWLLERHLLVRLSPTQVVLPREVALAARGNRTHRSSPPAPPSLPAQRRPPEAVGAESARAAEEVVRQVAGLLDQWDREPPVVLRAGGIGSRELRRIGLALDVDPARAALVVELAAMAGLIGPWVGGDDATWLRTREADLWLALSTAARWSALARAWLGSARAPWLVGTRNERGELRAALAPGLDRPWVPALRRAVLSVLSTWPADSAPNPDQVHELLVWRAPRAAPAPVSTEALLGEAAALGITGAGALSGAGRALLASASHFSGPRADAQAALGPFGLPGLRDLSTGQTAPRDTRAMAADAVAEALDADLPPLVEELVIQADLTGLVPGRPGPELATLLDAASDVESRGAALTVRFTPTSVRRAFNRGMTAPDLVESLRARSITPLPQPLEYLISDVARAHGSVRLGVASSYVRSEDVTALAALAVDPRLAPLGLRPLAPTVLVCAEPAARVLDLLRACDVGAVVEGPDGAVLSLDDSATRPRRARSITGGAARPSSGPTHPDPAHLARLVLMMREGDAWATAASVDHASSPAHLVELLRDAAANGRHVQLEMAGPTGSLQRRRLRPISVDAGRLRAVDPERESELTIAVHRIAGVILV
jgi:hypothetical protein